MPDRLQTAAALLRLRKQQRDATALQLAVAQRRHGQLDATALANEQRAASVEAECLAHFRVGSELDVGLHVQVLDAVAATTHVARQSRLQAERARQHRDQVRELLDQQDVARQLAENWQTRLHQERHCVISGKETAAALEAQNARCRQDETR